MKAASPETLRHIPVLTVQPADVPDLLEAPGTVRAAQTSDLASQVMGNIVETGLAKETACTEVRCLP